MNKLVMNYEPTGHG